MLSGGHIVVFGPNGLLGSHLVHRFAHDESPPQAIMGYTGDIRNRESVETAVSEFGADVMVNCAAFTDMDLAEKDPDAAYSVNSTAVRHLSQIADKRRVLFVHFSTGCVFNAKADQDRPFLESDVQRANGIYCKSKLSGEVEALRYGGSAVIRTHHLYGANGKNRASAMISTLQQAGEVRADTSQLVLPTWAGHVAEFTARLLGHGRPRGIYHAVSSGQPVTWYEFASFMLESVRTGAVLPIDQCGPAPRPKRCLIACSRRVPWKVPSWRQGLLDYVKSEVETP